VDEIIEAARWAPSGANSQPWEFIVIKKKELKDKIVELYGEHQVMTYRLEQTRPSEERVPRFVKQPKFPPGFAVAPVFILVLGDPRTKGAYPLSSFLDYGGKHFYSSLSSAFVYMTLAVTALGLGCRWLSATANPAMQCFIKQLLGIPDELEIYDMLVVGHVAEEPGPRQVRSTEEMVHHDYYDKGKFRTQEQVKDFIKATRISISDFHPEKG